jgi:hypothetical protein
VGRGQAFTTANLTALAAPPSDPAAVQAFGRVVDQLVPQVAYPLP